MKIKDRGCDRKIYVVSRRNQRALLVMMLVLATSYSIAQERPGTSSYEVQMIPENPDVANLGQFGSVPVNKYNGTANVTIPIHAIDLDGLKIPIALRYNTSGVRVNQDASWVGLGWSLSEGMSITREVNGYEDINNSNDQTGWIYSEDFYSPNAENGWKFEISAAEHLFLTTEFAANQPHDTEPDVFLVNLPSGSFKFHLPKIVDTETILNGLILDEKGYKVKYDIENFSFEVTDKNGFLYFFTETENSTGFGSYDIGDNTESGVLQGMTLPIRNTKKMISSWKVSTITSPYGNSLNFSYLEGFYFSYPHFSETEQILFQSGNTSYTPAEYMTNFSSNPTLSASFNAFHVKYLTKISGDFGAVKFNLSETDRIDLFTKEDKQRLAGEITAWEPSVFPNTYIAKRLENIQVLDSDNQVVKTAQFHYTYFNNQWVNDVDKVSYIRLKLESLDVLDQNYTFQYHNPDAMPRKDSKALDFWGFYNGVANSTRIPSMNRFYLVHMGATENDKTFERFYKYTGAIRKSDINFGKTGILTKVTYPTGGYTEFDYEGNTVTLKSVSFTPTSYISEGQLKQSGINSSEDYNFRYQYLKLANDPTYSLANNNTCLVASESFVANDEFEIFETTFCNNKTYNVKIQATLSCAVGCGQGINPTGPAVWIENINTSQIYNIFYYDGQFSQSNPVVLEHEMILPIGEYRFKYSAWSTSTPFLVVATATGSLTAWHDASVLDQEVYEEFEVGGARVAKVTNYDSDGSFVNAKEFSYDETIEDGSVSSSGILMDDLVFATKASGLYEYTTENFLSDQNGADASSNNKIRTSPSAAGSHIGYSQVEEQQVDAEGISIGKTVTSFANSANQYFTRPIGVAPQIWGCNGDCLNWDLSTEDDFLFYWLSYYGDVYILGILPFTFADQNGSIQEEEIYNNSAAQVKSISNTYIELEGSVGAQSLHPFYPILLWAGNAFPAFYPHRIIDQDDLLSIRKFQKIKTATTIEDFDGNQLSSFTEYFYDNPNHYLLTSTESTDSEGTLRTSKYYYPKDLETEPFMADLISTNRLSQRIKSESYKGVTLLFTEHTKYDNTTSTNGLVLPKEVFTYQGTLVEGEENQRVLYERYDTKGHLLQYRRKDNNIPTTLVWSYNTQYPVAKVANATFQQVAGALQITETTLMNFSKNNLGTLDALRSALPNAMVYIYSYDPLVGITTMTDSNGKSTTYNYDDFNRLKSIEDFQGNVIKAYEYHYK